MLTQQAVLPRVGEGYTFPSVSRHHRRHLAADRAKASLGRPLDAHSTPNSSFSVTVPHAFDPADAPPVSATATSTAAAINPPTRTFIPSPPLWFTPCPRAACGGVLA